MIDLTTVLARMLTTSYMASADEEDWQGVAALALVTAEGKALAALVAAALAWDRANGPVQWHAELGELQHAIDAFREAIR